MTVHRVFSDVFRRSALALVGLITTASLAPCQTSAPPEPIPQYAEAVPKLEPDTVLLNPHMGLYAMGGANFTPPADPWFTKMVDIAYIRDDWAKINPEEGVYKFDDYFGPLFDSWVKQRGKRLAFRFMSESMHSNTKYVSPKWIFDKGVPGVKHVGIYTPEQIDPVFWDTRYLDIQCEFIKQLGKYLDGRPGLEFIDIGCIGEWGEMHLMRWTPQQLEETGYRVEERRYRRSPLSEPCVRVSQYTAQASQTPYEGRGTAWACSEAALWRALTIAYSSDPSAGVDLFSGRLCRSWRYLAHVGS